MPFKKKRENTIQKDRDWVLFTFLSVFKLTASLLYQARDWYLSVCSIFCILQCDFILQYLKLLWYRNTEQTVIQEHKFQRSGVEDQEISYSIYVPGTTTSALDEL